MNPNEQEYLVQKIRTQYTEKQHTELDALKALDRKVKRPVQIFSYIFGTLAALIMGSGMSLIMTDLAASLGIAQPMLPGVIIGVAGLFLAVANYPIHRWILNGRRKKFASQIIALSDQILSD